MYGNKRDFIFLIGDASFSDLSLHINFFTKSGKESTCVILTSIAMNKYYPYIHVSRFNFFYVSHIVLSIIKMRGVVKLFDVEFEKKYHLK